jgi:hypothetical protein
LIKHIFVQVKNLTKLLYCKYRFSCEKSEDVILEDFVIDPAIYDESVENEESVENADDEEGNVTEHLPDPDEQVDI